MKATASEGDVVESGRLLLRVEAVVVGLPVIGTAAHLRRLAIADADHRPRERRQVCGSRAGRNGLQLAGELDKLVEVGGGNRERAVRVERDVALDLHGRPPEVAAHVDPVAGGVAAGRRPRDRERLRAGVLVGYEERRVGRRRDLRSRDRGTCRRADDEAAEDERACERCRRHQPDPCHAGTAGKGPHRGPFDLSLVFPRSSRCSCRSRGTCSSCRCGSSARRSGRIRPRPPSC